MAATTININLGPVGTRTSSLPVAHYAADDAGGDVVDTWTCTTRIWAVASPDRSDRRDADGSERWSTRCPAGRCPRLDLCLHLEEELRSEAWHTIVKIIID